MNSTQQKSDLLDAMGIPQWVSRGPAAGQSIPVTVEQLSDETQADNVAQISISGQAASGWLWLTEEAVTKKEQQLLSDIQLAVNLQRSLYGDKSEH
jgi:DNA polymerase III psi subunit